MNFEPSAEQTLFLETFRRFLDEKSSLSRVRAASASGFDDELWRGLAEMGMFGLRVEEKNGGLDLGLFDAALLMEEAGRALATGPLAEAVVTARLLASFGEEKLLRTVLEGESAVTLAFHDVANDPVQWIAGGAAACAVIVLERETVFLVDLGQKRRVPEENLASASLAELDLRSFPRRPLGHGPAAVSAFLAAVEEWKILTSAMLCGLSREALRLASAYACERVQFGQPIAAFQAVAHPLVDCLRSIDAGQLLVWKAIRDIADGDPHAGAAISIALWWNARAAASTATQALHSFGGYGLTTEYDIHLYNVRAKAAALVLGDPQQLIFEAGRRIYGHERPPLPEAGEVCIDFDLGDEARGIAAEIDALFQNDVTSEMRDQFHYSWEGHVPAVHRLLGQRRLLFPGLPPALGGREAGSYAAIAATERLERNGYTTMATGVAAMVAMIVDRFGSEAVRGEVLPRVISGEAACCLGYSEPGSGSDVFAANCRAFREEDGWRISGTKMFTSGAEVSDYVLMLCRTNTDAPKHKGLTMFLVPLTRAGITIQAVRTFQDERTNITFYDDVRISDDWRLGDVDGGVRAMAAALELEQGYSVAGPHERLVEAAEELARSIRAGGGLLIDTDDAQARLVRARARVWAAHMMQYRAAWSQTHSRPDGALSSMSKLFSSESFQESAHDLMDLTAPLSLSKRPGPAGLVNQCYRHAHGTTVYGGTSEIHRSIIGERALGLPRSRA